MGDNLPLWDGSDNNTNQPLRRPGSTKHVSNSTINNAISNETKNSLDMSNSFNNSMGREDDILATSRLSVDAKEWFPPNYNKNNSTITNITPHSAQDRIRRIKVSTDTQNLNTNEDMFSNMLNIEDGLEERESLQHLEELMSSLIVSPGDFDDLLGAFIETMTPFYEDVSFVCYIAESLVEKVLNEPNFRYSAVRLCVVIQQQCGLFRSTLCCLCQKKVNQNNDYHLTLLLAELYVQLNYDMIYCGLLINSLSGILLNGDGNNVKAACQVLKLTGAALELEHKKDIDDILKKLIASREKQVLSIKNLIDSVIVLRESKWGQTENNINLTNNSNQGNDVIHDGPILYGPDGQELTEEEHEFLNDNCSNHSDIYTDEMYGEDCWDPEMTEEMRTCYSEFIKLNN